MNNLPRLLQLCSQALPVGAYAYSQGLESAIHEGVVFDATSGQRWIEGVFQFGFSELDLVALALSVRALEAHDNNAEVLIEIDSFLQASRETSELLLEDIEMGRALRRLLDTLKLGPIAVGHRPSFATQFARAGVGWQIDRTDLLTGFCFGWLENQIAAATKSIPLGQSDAQLMLGRLIEEISAVVSRAITTANALDMTRSESWEFGLSLPGLSMMSSRHECQEARLYRS